MQSCGYIHRKKQVITKRLESTNMYTQIKQLTKRRSEMEEQAINDNSVFDDLDFQREIESVCAELMRLNSSFQKQTDRAIIEWDSKKYLSGF